jgi:hypothetical protein
VDIRLAVCRDEEAQNCIIHPKDGQGLITEGGDRGNPDRPAQFVPFPDMAGMIYKSDLALHDSACCGFGNLKYASLDEGQRVV